MGFDRGAVWVAGRVWCGLLSLAHKETAALELQLGVGAARGGLSVVVEKQVRGGDREVAEPVRA